MAARDDFTPTSEQINRGLNDKNKIVRDEFVSRQAAWEAITQYKELHEKFHPWVPQKIKKVL